MIAAVDSYHWSYAVIAIGTIGSKVAMGMDMYSSRPYVDNAHCAM